MHVVCGVTELKTRILIIMNLFQLKFFCPLRKKKIELCLYCYEEETRNSKNDPNKFCKNLDDRYDIVNLIRFNSN